MGTVVISGANGFIGKLVTERFCQEGFKVYSLVRKKKKADDPGLGSEIFSYEELEELKQAVRAENAIFYHFAWQGVNGTDRGNMNIQLQNIGLALRAADFAKEARCRKFLCAGSIAERSLDSIEHLSVVPEKMIYAAAKAALRPLLDTYCRRIGLDHVWMQFSNVYGPTNKTGNIIGYTLRQILNGKEAFFGPADQPYDLIYAGDLIEAVYRLGICETRRHFYFVGSGKPEILKSYLEQTGRIAGRKDLIKTGVYPNDGIRYDMDMFSTADLTEDIGNYVSGDFDSSMRYTVQHYFDEEDAHDTV